MAAPSQPAAAPQFLDSPPPSAVSSRRSVAQISAQSLAFIEHQYAAYLHDRNSVSPDWRGYFDEIHSGNEEMTASVLEAAPFQQKSIFHRNAPMPTHASRPPEAPIAANAPENVILQERLDQLIRNYRVRGHIVAQIDPLHAKRPSPPELDPAFYGFTQEHMQMEFSTQWFGGAECRTLQDMLSWLEMTYCRSIGVQFMHIDSLQVRSWLRDRMERSGNRIKLSRDEQVRILTRLSDAVMFEEFVQKKYVGAKSFSLEGAESLIPLLDLAIERAGAQGIDLIVMGMAHRGRLNVLANIMGKRPGKIFREFEDRDPEQHMGRGDVKYHLGYSSDWKTMSGQEVHLTLCFNPSHLEFVNPVVLGRLRSKQDDRGDYDRTRSMGIIIHGDAAFAGEGVVQETLNLSELAGYQTGGTLHIIVNNQVGFTTSPSEGRSCTYATDVARMLQSPIFHVNGEDPEAVAQVVHLAMDFRQKFRRDVIIDMYCFRRRGHNEGDEPAFTQPTMYQMIRQRKSVFESYLDSLLKFNELTRQEAEQIVERRAKVLEDELAEARKDQFSSLTDSGGGVWKGYFGGPASNADRVETSVAADELQRLGQILSTPPTDFTPHPRLKRILEQRLQMAAGDVPLDWGMAEILALGSLVSEGRQLRFSGQDVRRGTFSHRHAALHDANDGRIWIGLKELATRREQVEIYNSPLSEIGVLGFEYGYSLDYPGALTIWEAQFGDFVNVAQVIIDQFICSAEDKWNRLSGLVMLLPHGFEGQGPEHSSARLERFLMLAAEDNMQVVVPTTPAQHFHLLRRQTLRMWKKPLVVMTPKSLLRHKDAVSPLADLTSGRFHEVLADHQLSEPSQVQRILLCSGKIYYELESLRREMNCQHTALIRLEQLYPFPEAELAQALAPFGADVPVFWVQEEPRNMGAWPFMRIRFGDRLGESHPFAGITRRESASPATGSGTSHRIEQQAILKEAFEIT
ncbi:MAG: 2-oxoglutarate dehydrogenase E1 component [Planctomycetaceae bacterium]|nr:2-oxoglutarate dehydrogenase E1 component [Planctomycetaceae bacterium]